ncbi:MAG: UDP-N-acetylmuramoyl-L-alanine--D-glutamate ligase [Nannocystaceae bacterium]
MSAANPSAALPWRTALVIGLGESGRAAARLLARLGVEVRAYDQRADAPVPEGVLPYVGAPTIPEVAVRGIDLLVLSPGVPPSHARALAERLAPAAAIHGEMSLALDLFRRLVGDPPTVLVTGTNGKSTVTALTGALLEAGGLRPFVGGNLGVPLSSAVLERVDGGGAAPGALVLECSSYQLETMTKVRADVGMVLNVTPDHLDRYPTMEAYADTKARVFADLGAGGLGLLDAGDPFTPRLRQAVPPARLTLVDAPPAAEGASIVGEGPGRLLRLRSGEAFERGLLGLAGRHNSKNALFALEAARHLGVDADACAAGLRAFVGLPHRMVLVRELAGVTYYDDSKATNVASVLASLGGFDRRFVLIAGGRAKGDDLTPLRELLARQGRALVALGESRERFAALAEDLVPVARAATMDEAVAEARALAQPGDAVVLSPACSSFDLFRNYAERGETFARLVDALT